MPSKRYNTEGIIHKREADVLLSQGSRRGMQAARGVSKRIIGGASCRRHEGPGEALESAGRGKCAAIADLTVDKQIEVAEGNY